ncbi:MAG: hypothetical protein ACWGQW_00955 [bacterium]
MLADDRDKLKKHPVDVFKNRRMRLTRVHALEVMRRALEEESQEPPVPPSPQMGLPQPGGGNPQFGGM